MGGLAPHRQLVSTDLLKHKATFMEKGSPRYTNILLSESNTNILEEPVNDRNMISFTRLMNSDTSGGPVSLEQYCNCKGCHKNVFCIK